MTTCIILTAAQASAVAGEVSPGYAIEPRLMADGNFAVSARVLEDAGYSGAWPVLADLPQRDLTPNDFPLEISE